MPTASTACTSTPARPARPSSRWPGSPPPAPGSPPTPATPARSQSQSARAPTPQGNLISGNAGNGVLLTGGAVENFLEGNFIGTTVSGLKALGNALDGVAIVNAPGNSLVGTIKSKDPFIYYNVVSGNGGNGLRIRDSD